MLGWRARIGLILPADNVVIEPELYELGLPGVTYHAARLPAVEHDAMRALAEEAACTLHETGVDVVVYCCAETSFDAGAARRAQLTSVLEVASGVPANTATGAMVTAIRQMQLSKISLVTPYTDETGARFEQTLSDEGVGVIAAIHRDFRHGDVSTPEWYATNRQSPTTTYEMLRAANSPAADGVVVCSTNLPFMSVLEQAERDLGKTVIGCNQSIIWWCLSALGIKEPIDCAGRLLREPR
jgi:maleate isomerase